MMAYYISMKATDILSIKKANMKAPGIYALINTKTNKCYIGQSKNIHKRKLSHINELNKGTHSNGHLQNSWKLDKESFVFVPIENTEDLNAREAYWLNNFNKKDLYNLKEVNSDEQKWEASEEFRKEIGKRTKKVLLDENIRVKVSIKKRKLQPEQINEVRRRYINLEKIAHIGKSLGVSEDCIGQITRGIRCAIGPGIDKNLVEEAKKRVYSYKEKNSSPTQKTLNGVNITKELLCVKS